MERARSSAGLTEGLAHREMSALKERLQEYRPSSVAFMSRKRFIRCVVPADNAWDLALFKEPCGDSRAIGP